MNIKRELTFEERMFMLAHELACYGSELNEETVKYYMRPVSEENKSRLDKVYATLENLYKKW